MIEPVKHGDSLLDEIRATEPGDGFALWWLGQSGFLIKAAPGYLLFDPYLSDSLTTKYADTDKPHTRMTACVLDPAQLDFIEVMTSSHNHTDHLDAQTLGPIWQACPQAQLVIPEANRQFVAERLGCDAARPLGLTDSRSLQVGGFKLHGIAAAHDRVDRDDTGLCRYLGYVATWGNHAVYHSGDTLWHDGLVKQLSSFSVDVALLPINGRLPRRRVAGNLWGQEAATLANDIGAALVVPCHYDMFTFNTETPDAFVAKCRELGQAHQVLACGERLIVR